jgi:hypothetical protein
VWWLARWRRVPPVSRHELEDGTLCLRLEDLQTSNGSDLCAILTDQLLSDDWHVSDDGEVVDLGPLKGNLGSSNYEIPLSLDLGRLYERRGFRPTWLYLSRVSLVAGRPRRALAPRSDPP